MCFVNQHENFLDHMSKVLINKYLLVKSNSVFIFVRHIS